MIQTRLVTEASRKNPLGPTGVVAARRVRELRDRAGLSYKQLADELAGIGRPIPALGLRRIESEDRRIDADDLVALAVVLGVNPSALLLPPTIKGDVEITGAGLVLARQAWDWADGTEPLRPVDDDGSARVEFQLRARPEGRRRLSPATERGRAALGDELRAMGADVDLHESGRLQVRGTED